MAPRACARLAWSDKTLYIGFGMVVAGAVATIVVERAARRSPRHARARRAAAARADDRRAKLARARRVPSATLIGRHARASASVFGVLLGNFGDVAFALRGHRRALRRVVARVGVRVFRGASIQGVRSLVLGPRLFARISARCPAAARRRVIAWLLALPSIGGSAVRSLEDAGVRAARRAARRHTTEVHPSRPSAASVRTRGRSTRRRSGSSGSTKRCSAPTTRCSTRRRCAPWRRPPASCSSHLSRRRSAIGGWRARRSKSVRAQGRAGRRWRAGCPRSSRAIRLAARPVNSCSPR